VAAVALELDGDGLIAADGAVGEEAAGVVGAQGGDAVAVDGEQLVAGLQAGLVGGAVDADGEDVEVARGGVGLLALEGLDLGAGGPRAAGVGGDEEAQAELAALGLRDLGGGDAADRAEVEVDAGLGDVLDLGDAAAVDEVAVVDVEGAGAGGDPRELEAARRVGARALAEQHVEGGAEGEGLARGEGEAGQRGAGAAVDDDAVYAGPGLEVEDDLRLLGGGEVELVDAAALVGGDGDPVVAGVEVVDAEAAVGALDGVVAAAAAALVGALDEHVELADGDAAGAHAAGDLGERGDLQADLAADRDVVEADAGAAAERLGLEVVGAAGEAAELEAAVLAGEHGLAARDAGEGVGVVGTWLFGQVGDDADALGGLLFGAMKAALGLVAGHRGGGHPGVGDRGALAVDDDAAQDAVAQLDAEVEAGVGDGGGEGGADGLVAPVGVGPADDVAAAVEDADLVFAAVEAAQGVAAVLADRGAVVPAGVEGEAKAGVLLALAGLVLDAAAAQRGAGGVDDPPGGAGSRLEGDDGALEAAGADLDRELAAGAVGADGDDAQGAGLDGAEDELAAGVGAGAHEQVAGAGEHGQRVALLGQGERDGGEGRRVDAAAQLDAAVELKDDAGDVGGLDGDGGSDDLGERVLGDGAEDVAAGLDADDLEVAVDAARLVGDAALHRAHRVGADHDAVERLLGVVFRDDEAADLEGPIDAQLDAGERLADAELDFFRLAAGVPGGDGGERVDAGTQAVQAEAAAGVAAGRVALESGDAAGADEGVGDGGAVRLGADDALDRGGGGEAQLDAARAAGEVGGLAVVAVVGVPGADLVDAVAQVDDEAAVGVGLGGVGGAAEVDDVAVALGLDEDDGALDRAAADVADGAAQRVPAAGEREVVAGVVLTCP
jgi:hypothetical protein